MPKPGAGASPMPHVEMTLRPYAVLPHWTRFCWWLSERLNRRVFGKRSFTPEQWSALTPEEQAKW